MPHEPLCNIFQNINLWNSISYIFRPPWKKKVPSHNDVKKPSKRKPLTFVGLDEYFYCEDSNRMKCRNCSMIFQTKAVSGHIPRCQSNKFVCALCSRGFLSDEALKTHKRENHFTCEVCGRDFIDAGDFLERHQLKCKKMKELKLAGQVVGETIQ